MMASIGVPKSIDLTRPAGEVFPICGANGVDCYFLLKKHITRVLVGIAALIFGYKFPFNYWRKIGIPFFFGMFVLLFLVLIIGKSFTTFATSWLTVFNTSIQPTELAKLALIFYLGLWMERKGRDIEDFHKGFVSFCILSGVIILPIILQPDLGSTMIFTLISVSMYYLAGAKFKHIATGVVATMVALAVIVPFNDYLKYRVKAYLSPTSDNCQVESSGSARDYCWQTEQANIAVASGGFIGKGLTQGVQKSYWLPQASDDFIFAASSEELGFVRISLVVLAFFIIGYRGSLIAKNAPDRFSMFTALGITVWLAGQAFVNIGVNIGLLPVTGVTLPFISYGGSSMVATCLAAGVLLNISTTTPRINESTSNRRRKRRSRYA